MPSGDPRQRPGARGQPRPARGLTYIGLLVLLAMMGALLAVLGTQWQLRAQREREAELRFRGTQIREAIARYRDAQQPAALPASLDDLLSDARGSGAPRHHLRRRWTDPFTGQDDWVLLRDARGGLLGVHSRATHERLGDRGGTPPAAGQSLPRVSDWRFAIDPLPAPDPASTGAPAAAAGDAAPSADPALAPAHRSPPLPSTDEEPSP